MTTIISEPGKIERQILSKHVPLAASYEEANGDANRGRRLELVKSGWASFDDLVRQQNRTIEENVRMLSGQHHSIYHPVLNRWLDVSEWMPRDEMKWRARAVINRLLPWYMVTHARATENTPIISYVPGPDELDAELAQVLDIVGKTTWWEANMEDVHDRLMGWVIVAGRGHLLSRINTQKGRLRPWVGRDLVPLVDAYEQPIPDNDGGQAHVMMDGVPFDKEGKALAVARPNGAGYELVPTGEPHATPIGALEVDVLSPMQVRGSWGPQPWHAKRRHFIRSFHTPEEIFDMYGVEVKPNVRGGSVSDIGELERLLFGTGFYNAAGGEMQAQTTATNIDGYVEVTQLWEAPCGYGGMERTEESPGGRWLVCTPDVVLRDGVRPADFPYTSPLNTFEFVRIPGRPGGTTPQEALNPIQKLYNDGYGRIRDHVNLSTNPKGVIDAGSGMKTGSFTNKPGENYILTRRPGVPAIEFVAPPRLGEDVYRFQEMLRGELDDIGFMIGASDPGAPGESGEKLKEARFNTDRYMGPTMRRAAGEYGRMFETWGVLYPLIFDMETVLHYAGDDNVARTVTVFPELFQKGKADVRPDVESMLPEGRGEKQEKVYKFYMDGLFGLPGTPEALKKFWEAIHMPHLGRVGKPGGVDRVTAEQENGELLLGADPMGIPVYEWYDDLVHLMVHESFMKSPEFKKQAPEVQDAFALHRKAHMFNLQIKMARSQPQPAPGGGGGGSAPKKSGSKSPDVPSPRPGLPEPPASVAGGMPTVSPAAPPLA